MPRCWFTSKTLKAGSADVLVRTASEARAGSSVASGKFRASRSLRTGTSALPAWDGIN
jgi:hypothetical protein